MHLQKKVPEVLFQKVLVTALIGMSCMVTGIAYYIYARDIVFLALSGLILLFSLLRSISLYKTITRQKFETVVGICVGISVKPFQKQSRIRIIDKEGIETTLRLGKQPRVKIGFLYRFYFKQNQPLSLGNEYLDTILTTDYFLGFEELGKSSNHSEEPERTNKE